MHSRLIVDYMEPAYADYASELLEAYFDSLQEMSCRVSVFPVSQLAKDVKSQVYPEFIYDRPSQNIILGGRNFHSSICRVLYELHYHHQQGNTEFLQRDCLEVIAEAIRPSINKKSLNYLNYFGCYRSSISLSSVLQVGPNFLFNAQELLLFRDYRVLRVQENVSLPVAI